MTAPTLDLSRRTWVELVMGLPVSVTVRGPGAREDRVDRAVQAVFAELHRVDRVFSPYRQDSEISRLRSGALPLALARPEVAEVLRLCELARTLTDGCFDAHLPGGLDPSGLVKGWAVERAARLLEPLTPDWIVNAGGDVLARAAHGPAWRVAVEDPADPSRLLCVLPVRSGAVATSSTAARGRHLIDPRTGQPARDRLRSATVLGPSLTWADVLATAAFVEGPDALDRVTRLDGYEALLVHTPCTAGGNPQHSPHGDIQVVSIPRSDGALRMRKQILIATTAGVLGLSGAALAGPALAAAGSTTATASTTAASDRGADRITTALAGLVSDGTLTQAQADQVATTLAASGGERGGGKGGHGRGPGLGAAATALGLSEADLRTVLQGGQSLAQVAEAQGVDVDTLIADLVAAEQTRTVQAVTDGRITQAQADERLADVTARVTERVNDTRSASPGRGGPPADAPTEQTPEATPTA